MGGAGDAAGGVTDRVFGQTEQAEAMELLRETHPDWHQESFLSMINDSLGPDVLRAYLKGDLDSLRETTREQAYAMLAASVNERKERQLLMDPRSTQPQATLERTISHLTPRTPGQTQARLASTPSVLSHHRSSNTAAPLSPLLPPSPLSPFRSERSTLRRGALSPLPPAQFST